MLLSHRSIVPSLLVLLFMLLVAAVMMGPARAASAQPVTITIEVAVGDGVMASTESPVPSPRNFDGLERIELFHCSVLHRVCGKRMCRDPRFGLWEWSFGDEMAQDRSG